jgi:hypothetical protein
MSNHAAFRRQPVPGQVANRSQAVTLPAPTRGIIESENFAFMQPGAALICDNWVPTMRGVKLRGGCIKWSTLPERTPVISGFEYITHSAQRMFAANATGLYDVTFGGPAAVVKTPHGSGNYTATQFANAGDEWLIAVNDAGDAPLRFDGAVWETLDEAYDPVTAGKPSKITGPVDSVVEHGGGLVHVTKYRNRLYFIEINSMNAWYLPLNAVGGLLEMIPLSGAANRGGKLLFSAVLSMDAGDGVDDKILFVTTLGEVIVFTGSDPGNPTTWRQEGRFQVPPPMGKNAHMAVGGDLLIATVDGIIPVTAAITKEGTKLQLAAITHAINHTWREEVATKREWNWTLKKWDEYGAIFVSWPGSRPGYCAVANAVTLAWSRFVGWDATCFLQLRTDMFFGTTDGYVMQADRTGRDDGKPYVATLVGGWGVLQQHTATTTWKQARAVFQVGSNEPFIPQISAAADYTIKLPQPPQAGADVAGEDTWDQGLWDQAKWDQGATKTITTRSTGWISVGVTGYTLAPIVQVTVAQTIRPNVEMIAMDITFVRGGVTV